MFRKFQTDLILTFLLFSLLACNRIEDKQIDYGDDSILTIDIPNIKSLKEDKLSNLISDFRYVPLETMEDSFIGEISRLILTEDRIFIHDGVSRALLIFDKNGVFQNKIEALGNGPEEFSELVSFTIDTENNHVIIGAVGKIIAFDFDGNYAYGFKTILGGAFQIAYTGNGRLAIYTNYIPLDEAQDFNHVVVWDLDKKKIVSRAIPFEMLARIENMTNFYNNISSTSSSDKYLTIPYKNYIWKLDGEEVIPKYRVDFGTNELPVDYEKDFLSNPKYTSSRLRDIEFNEGYQRLNGGGALVNDNFLNFSYSGEGDFFEVFHDLVTKKTHKFEVPLNNDLDGSKYVIQRATFKDSFVSITTASGLIKRAEEGRISNPRILEVISQLEEEDNPILRIFKYKGIQ